MYVFFYILTLTNNEMKNTMICCRHCRLFLLLDWGQQYFYKNYIAFLKLFFSNCYFKKNICKSHQNSEKRFWRKVLEKGNNKNRCNLVPSSEWLFNLIFVSFLVTTESNGRNLNCRYHTKLLLSINNVVYSILPTYFTLKKISVPYILKQ